MSTTTSVYLTTGPNAAVKCPISWKKKENSRHCESSSIFLVHSSFLLHCPLSCHEFYSVAIPFLEFSRKSKIETFYMEVALKILLQEKKRSLASLCDLNALASEILDLRALASEILDLRAWELGSEILRSEEKTSEWSGWSEWSSEGWGRSPQPERLV